MDGGILNISQNGITLEVYFNTPTKSEVKDFSAESEFKVGLFKKDGILFMLTKFGNSNWMDAPYSIRLEKEIPNPLQAINDVTLGYPLMFC